VLSPIVCLAAFYGLLMVLLILSFVWWIRKDNEDLEKAENLNKWYKVRLDYYQYKLIKAEKELADYSEWVSVVRGEREHHKGEADRFKEQRDIAWADRDTFKNQHTQLCESFANLIFERDELRAENTHLLKRLAAILNVARALQAEIGGCSVPFKHEDELNSVTRLALKEALKSS